MCKRNILAVIIIIFTMIICSCASSEIPAKNQQIANDTDPIENMKAYIEDNYINIKSFILIKDGKTIDETYLNGTKKDTTAPIFSCTKSIISALVGIAIEEGKIKSVDQKVVDLLDTQQMSLKDDSKYDITLKHLLTMSSGLDPLISDEFVSKENAIKYTLEQPMRHQPGEVFEYTNAGPHIISAIIQQATGMETSEYAQKKLFDPLGIAKPEWQKDATGLALGGFGLELTPLQLASFGTLFLNEGTWNDKQIISKDWIYESTGRIIDTAVSNEREQSGYGYLWWQNGFGGYSAQGYAGQYIFILPNQNAVAVFTSRLSESDFFIPYQLMKTYVLPVLE